MCLGRILEKVEPIEDNKKLEDLTKQMSEMTGKVTEQGNQLKVLKETTNQQEIELRQVFFFFFFFIVSHNNSVYTKTIIFTEVFKVTH